MYHQLVLLDACLQEGEVWVEKMYILLEYLMSVISSLPPLHVETCSLLPLNTPACTNNLLILVHNILELYFCLNLSLLKYELELLFKQEYRLICKEHIPPFIQVLTALLSSWTFSWVGHTVYRSTLPVLGYMVCWEMQVVNSEDNCCESNIQFLHNYISLVEL